MFKRNPEKKEKKRMARRKRAMQRALIRRARKHFLGKDAVIGPPMDGLKMSEVLGEFVEPYKELAETEEGIKIC